MSKESTTKPYHSPNQQDEEEHNMSTPMTCRPVIVSEIPKDHNKEQ
mgnify:CR=1 FL=1